MLLAYIKWFCLCFTSKIDILTTSFLFGSLPAELKITIHKGGPGTEPTNYRAICILPAVDKIFERMFNQQMLEYHETQKLLLNRQYGFRFRSNTDNTAVFDFINVAQNKN